MSNQFIEKLRQNAKFELRYNAFGLPISVNIFTDNSTTCIPLGNDNFAALIEFIESNGIKPIPDINWVQVVRDADGQVLYYKCNQGSFIDNDNPISNQIRQGIESGSIKVRELDNLSPVVEIQASVFLPRTYTLCEDGPKPISRYEFNENYLGLPFKAQVGLMQSIEADYFDSQKEFFQPLIKNLTGNVIRIGFEGSQIRSVYNWSKFHLDSELLHLSS